MGHNAVMTASRIKHDQTDVSSCKSQHIRRQLIGVFCAKGKNYVAHISLQFCGILVSLDFHSSLFNFSKDCCILVCSYIGPISFCMDQKSQDVSLFNVQMQWALIVGYYPSLHRHLCTFSSAVQFDVSFGGWGGGHFHSQLIWQPNRQLLRRSQAKTKTQAKTIQQDILLLTLGREKSGGYWHL